jgi:hypothetical protein
MADAGAGRRQRGRKRYVRAENLESRLLNRETTMWRKLSACRAGTFVDASAASRPTEPRHKGEVHPAQERRTKGVGIF